MNKNKIRQKLLELNEGIEEILNESECKKHQSYNDDVEIKDIISHLSYVNLVIKKWKKPR